MKLATLSVVLLFLATPTIVHAQGTIRGTVTDSVSHEKLVGVNVIIVGKALGSSTNIDGQYKILQAPAGRLTLKASCIGYKTRQVEVELPNQDVTVNFDVVPDVIQGEEIVVTGQARGQVAAINQQLASNTIVNVVSEEKIQQLPDANAAEAIGRLPGVSISRSGGEANRAIVRGMSDKFGTVTVDGIRMASTDVDTRGIDLSTVSQGSLAGIELFKALTADQDADAIAGSINLVTKKAPSERLVRLESKGVYNKLNKNLNQYDFSLRYGERFFDDVLGLQLSGNIEQRDRSNESDSIDYNVNKAIGNDRDYEINNFYVKYVDEVRKRGGFSLMADINTPDEGTIKFSNVFNSTKRDQVTYSRDYPVDNPNPFYSARNQQKEISTFNSFVRGDNTVFGLGTSWGLSFAQSRGEDPYDYQMDFFEPSAADTAGNPTSGMASIPDSKKKGPPELLIPYALNNFSKAYLYDAYYRSEKNLEKEKTAFLDLTRDYAFGDNFSGSLKVGGKYRYKTRFKEKSELLASYYLGVFPAFTVLPDGRIVRKSYEGSPFNPLILDGDRVLVPNFLDPNPASRSIYGQYLLNPMINRDRLRAWYEYNRNGVSDSLGHGTEYNRNNATDADYYDIVERVSAGYVMNTFKIGQEITFIAGLRVESEKNDYASRFSPQDLSGFPTPTGLIKDTSVTYTETIWLPNFQTAIRPTDDLTFRLAAYKAIARPDYNWRLENFIARKAGTFYPNNSLNVGNPRLKAAKAWNFELTTSFHNNTVGLISLSGFYKNIKDMFHVANGVRIEGLPDHNQRILDSLGILWKAPTYGVPIPAFFLTYAYNSPRATQVWGFEFEHQANLKFLPGVLQNLVLNYNLSIIRSETYVLSFVSYRDTIFHPPFPPSIRSRTEMVDVKYKLEGQPDLFGNVALGYEIGGFSARMSVFFQGAFNKSFSGDGKSDEVTDAFSKWDFVVRQTITDNIAVMLNLNNFTNVKEDNTLSDREKGWELRNAGQLYGLTADLGVRISF
jgi:TonB-dependent receptor